MRRTLSLLAAFVFVALGVFPRLTPHHPCAWVFSFGAFALACIGFAVAARRDVPRYLFLVLFSFLTALFFIEGNLAYKAARPVVVEGPQRRNATIEEIRLERDDPTLMPEGANIVHDPLLGFKPEARKAHTASKVYFGDDLVFDAEFNTEDSGWRVTPRHPEADKAVVFFGCSYTFGFGLNDNESLPYKLGELLGGQYQTFNFGNNGYGANQMLAQIENGYLDDIAERYKEVSVFFLTIYGHEERAAGVANFSPISHKGPGYEIENGRAVYKGQFADRLKGLKKAVHEALSGSLTYAKLIAPRKRDIKRYRKLHVAIMVEADRYLRERYGIPLVVLVWPGSPVRETLLEKGVIALEASAFLPDWEHRQDEYMMRHDNHPNAKGVERLALGLADLVRSGPGSPRP
jgi:hypothetical protein